MNAGSRSALRDWYFVLTGALPHSAGSMKCGLRHETLQLGVDELQPPRRFLERRRASPPGAALPLPVFRGFPAVPACYYRGDLTSDAPVKAGGIPFSGRRG